MANSKRQTGIEWIGGLVMLPGFVTGEGEPYRPEALLWVDGEGSVIGMHVDKPGAALGHAAASLRETMQRPMWGRPQVPTRVRVAKPELAAALREQHPGIEFLCAPTPEIDTVLAAMDADMAERAPGERSYLAPDVTADMVAALFQAAATLYRTQPWAAVPGDACIAVSIEELGLRDAALSIIGQLGESFGFILFRSIEEHRAFMQAAAVIERGERPALPPHLALNFERGAEMGNTLRKEIATHGWEVATANAYPWLIAVDTDLLARGPTATEIRMVEAIALALPMLLQERAALDIAWETGPPLALTVTVHTHTGNTVVRLQAPHQVPSDLSSVIEQLQELGMRGELDSDTLRPLEDALVRHFAASAEASALENIHMCGLVMDLAAGYCGATIVTLSATQLREILFEIIPRKVSLHAAAARPIIEELRAFYTFLERAARLAQASACLRLLGASAVKRLEAALNDTSKFGMAKSLLMGGKASNFDLESQEGIEELLKAMQNPPQPKPPKAQKSPKSGRSKSAKARPTTKQGRRKTGPKKRR
jgi:hypothetical protein